MKRVFTLALVLSMVVSGMAQQRVQNRVERKAQKAEQVQTYNGFETVNYNGNVASQRSMMAPEEIELGMTVYDWQTNAAARNQTVAWEDGFAAVCWTHANETGLADRGTGISYYDPATGEWSYCEHRAEDVKTGFGCIARYGEEGLVIAAHTATQCGIWINEKFRVDPEAWGEPIWLDATYDPCWPVIATSGENHDIIHIFATASGNTVEGVFEPLLYFRYANGAWQAENQVIEPLNASHALSFSSNDAHFIPVNEPNRVAAVINSTWCDGKVVVSEDNGETWSERTYYRHPGFDHTFDAQFMYPRWVDAAFDADDVLHIVYEFNGSTGHALDTDGSYYPGIGGVSYWSEVMPLGADYVSVGFTGQAGQPFVMDTNYISQDIYASWFWSDATHEFPVNEYIGFVPPMLSNNGQITIDYENIDWTFFNDFGSEHGKYNCGIAGMPTMLYDNGNIYVVYSSITPALADDMYPYFRLLGNASYDNGVTWEGQNVLLNDFMNSYDEMVYGQFVPYVYHDSEGAYAFFIYQNDTYPGTSVQEDDPDADDNGYRVVKVRLDNETWGEAEIVNAEESVSIYPNPVNTEMTITLPSDSEVVICNLMGQVVSSFNGVKGVNSFDASNLTSGVYFLTAANTTQKFVVK